VKRFFGFLNVLDDYKKHMFFNEDRYYGIDFPTESDFKKAISDFCIKIPKLRHEAIYQDRRYSIMEYPYLQKNTLPPEDLTTSRIDFIKKFNEDMINWQFKNLKYILDEIESRSSSKDMFLKFIAEIGSMPSIHHLKMELDLDKLHENLSKNRNIRKAVPSFINLFISQ